MKKDKIIAILGPTSSGKSDVAIKLAKKFNGEVISADSRQIYRGMDVGTGKVQKSKCKNQNAKLFLKNKKIIPYVSSGINHYLIDIVSPSANYNVAKFEKDANYVINYIIKRGKLPIVCGGTGFWIKAIVDNVDFPEVKPNKELRKKLEKLNTEKLFKMLQKLDRERARDIDEKNKARLIRAIEIVKVLGFVPKINNIKNIKYDFLQIGIDILKEKLHQNIKKRLEKRFKRGMIKEIEKLHSSGLNWKKIQSFGLGYFWIPLYLQGKVNKKDLFEKIYQAEKNYAKRQMTWFKKDERIIWLKKYEEIDKKIRVFIKD